MRDTGVMACLVIALLWSQVIAADQEQDAEAAISKAEVLEQSVTANGDEASPEPSETITSAEAQAVDPAGDAPLDDALTCLSRTIYWESKGATSDDMEAVANVVMNRLAHEGFPNTICEVVTQGAEQGPCQFSWWCDGRPVNIREEEPHATAMEIARQALNQELADQTDGALYFHDKNVSPSWSTVFIQTAETDSFVLYKPHKGAAN